MKILYPLISFFIIVNFVWAEDIANEECQLINKLLGKSETYDCCSHNPEEVKCSDSHITYLNLSNHQILGNLSEDIGNLTYLEELDLSVNRFSGPIPSTIGNLINLKNLNLSTNTFDKQIPSTIGNLVNLEYLYLNDNQLKEYLPSEIGNLSKLVELNLNKNALKGNIPSEIGNLVNLKKLLISGNAFVGTIPYSVGNLKQLEYLHVANNKLSSELPTDVIEELTQLKGLNLENNNNLYGRIPKNKFESCKYSVTKLCYAEDKNPNCIYPSTHYTCDTCKDTAISTIIEGVCKCNEGYKGAGYIECKKCGDNCNDDEDGALAQNIYKLFNVVLIIIVIGILQL